MTQDEKKKATGEAAVEYVKPGSIIGVGTGSTVNYFIDALEPIKEKNQRGSIKLRRVDRALKSLRH